MKVERKKNEKNLKVYIKMEIANINFGDFETKQKFHQHKSPISINNINIKTK